MTIPIPVEGLTFSFTNVAISGSAGTGDFAIAGSVSINILGLRTRAWIADDVQINAAGALPGSSAEVTATDVSTVKSVAGALAVTSGSAGIGAAIVVDVIDKDTRAYIGSGVTLRVAGDVNVASTAGMTYFALAASAGGSTSAAVSGSIIVAIIDQGSDDGTRAFIDDPTAVESGGALSVTASAPNTYELYAGQIAVASSAGVGLSLVIFVNTGIVDAFIGAFDTITAGAGGVTVSAFQSEDIKLIAVGGSVGGSAGIAGSATIDVLSLTTTGHIDHNATVTSGGKIAVSATDNTTILGIAGALSIGGSAGVGVGADIEVPNKHTEAWIGDSVARDGRRRRHRRRDLERAHDLDRRGRERRRQRGRLGQRRHLRDRRHDARLHREQRLRRRRRLGAGRGRRVALARPDRRHDRGRRRRRRRRLGRRPGRDEDDDRVHRQRRDASPGAASAPA